METESTAPSRERMVEFQLRRRGIRDQAVLAAMSAVPRELFVPPELSDLAYADEALPIEEGQTISQPWIVARMSELLEARQGMPVLEVGTGSGYQTAVLAAMGCRVVSVERHAALAEVARARLAGLGLEASVRIEVGDGSRGWPADAPFEGIMVTAAAPSVPGALRDQLADGGRLVIPVGRRERQDLVQVVRSGSEFRTQDHGPCVFVPLIGAEAFPEGGGRPRSWRDRLRS